MKNYTYSTALILAGLILVTSCKTDPEAKLQDLKDQQAALAEQIAELEKSLVKKEDIKSKDVVAVTITPQKFEHFIQTQGSVYAEDNVQVSAKAMGVVTAVYVTEGQTVTKGQVLAQIDNAVLVSNIESLKSQLALAATVYERQQNLWNQKIGTEVQLLQAKTNKESLEKQLQALEAQNDMTRIKAPIAGTVDGVLVKVGENISPGYPALRVVSATDLKLKINVSEVFITKIKKGNKVRIQINELGKEIEGTVAFVAKSIDPLSRTFLVEVKLPNNAGLLPNMTGIAKVVFHEEAAALVVPVNVVQDINNEKVIYVAKTENGRTIAHKKVVNVVGIYDGKAQVEGLEDGDQIITVGYQGLGEGQNLALQK
jgi:membrane fusion protein (multidrug efflux system)